MNNVIISSAYPEYGSALNKLGYNVIPGECVDRFISYERYHVDMQCLIIEDHAFVLNSCKRLINALSGLYSVVPVSESTSGEYPYNVPLNAAVIGRRIIARVDSLDANVRSFCEERGYELINVKQGYAKCSCAIVSDNALITADRGIYNSLKETKIEALLIEKGRVALPGADCGFIGGASGLDISNGERILYFCGNVSEHTDYMNIKSFCEKHGTTVKRLTDGKLTDIGGMIFC